MSSKPNQQRPITEPLPFNTHYSARQRHTITFPSEGRTHQSFKDECDINIIMGRYLKTGILPENLNAQEAQYLDVSEIDYQEAVNIVAGARSLFEQMPSAIRNRFENDPAKLLAFLSDDKNRQEAVEMGLVGPQTTAAIPNPQPTTSNPSKAAKSAPAPSGQTEEI